MKLKELLQVIEVGTNIKVVKGNDDIITSYEFDHQDNNALEKMPSESDVNEIRNCLNSLVIEIK